jgi:vitamin B12 transporter
LAIWIVAFLLIAQTEEDEVRVTGRRERPESPRQERTLAATELDPDAIARAGRGPGPELARAPAVRWKSTGSELHLSWLLIRGSSPVQVAYFLDGLPLAAGYGAALDLATLPVSGLGSLELFRGAVPAELGPNAIGGALNLVPKSPDRPLARLYDTRGSFGTWKLAGLAGGGGPFPWLVAGAVGTTRGDYRYFNDGGTIYTTVDDGTHRRENNAVTQMQVLGAGSRRLPFGRLRALVLASDRVAGVPGPHAIVTSRTSHRQTRARAQATLDSDAGRSDVYAELIRDHYQDPLGELGVGAADNLHDFQLTGLRHRWLHARGRQELSLVPHAFLERWAPTRLSYGEAGDHARGTLWGSARWRLRDRRWLATAVVHGALSVPDDAPARRHVGFTAGAAFTPRRGLRLRANVARSFREPAFSELYADFGAFKGNRELAPELSHGADAGVHLDLRQGPWRLGAEFGVFGRRVQDLIQYVPNSQFVSTPQNVGEADFVGAEGRLMLGWRGLRLESSATFLDTENRSGLAESNGKPLPGRPRWTVAGGLSWRGLVAGHRITPAVELHFEHDAFWDTAGRRPMPDRLQIDARLAWTLPGGRVTLAVDARNLLDRLQADVLRLPEPAAGPLTHPQAVSDQLGYPLPGRSVFFTVSLEI